MNLRTSALVLACGIAIASHRAPSADILWFLDVARRVAHGQVLYRDILEVNPPLIVWVLLPFAPLAHPLPVFLGAVVVLMTVSSLATARALGGRWMLPALLTVLLIVPIGWFGQREHLAIALILPWLAATLDKEGAGWPRGIAAGIGFGLKPHLFLVFILIVLFRRRLDPGSRAVLAIIAAYVAAVLIFTPTYLTLARSMGGDYWTYQRVGLAELLWKNPSTWLALLGPAAWLLVRHHTTDHTQGDGLSLATVGFLCAAVLQGKGWNYHYAPTVTTGLLLLALVAAQPLRPLVLLTRFVTAAILFGFVRQAWLGYLRPAGTNPDVVDAGTYQRLVHELGDAGHPRSMLALYRHSGQAFALTTFGGVRFVSPFPMIWVLDAPGWEAKLPWWINQILLAATRDPPDLILLSHDPVDGGRTFDELLIGDSSFDALLSRYQSRPDAGGYRVFVAPRSVE